MKLLTRLLVIFLSCSAVASIAAQDADLLDPEAAFRFSAHKLNAKTIEVRFDIADGYYMYRNKFRFQLSPLETRLGKVKYPKGKIKNDPLFGRVETYRTSVKMLLPFSALPADGNFTLTAISQGCADVGVCYTPMTSHKVFVANDTESEPKPMSSVLGKPR